jgi:hypothetical protein
LLGIGAVVIVMGVVLDVAAQGLGD